MDTVTDAAQWIKMKGSRLIVGHVHSFLLLFYSNDFQCCIYMLTNMQFKNIL